MNEFLTACESGAPVHPQTEADRILLLAIDLGEHIVRNGGEVARAEDTIERVCRAAGGEHVEAFALTSLIVASVRMSDGSFSHQIRHIRSSSLNLYRVEQMNSISRRFCAGEITVEEALALVQDYKKKQPYSSVFTHLGAVILVMGFTVFFGGTWFDATAAGCVALVVSLFSSLPMPFNNGMFKTVVASFVSGALSVVCVHIGFGQHLDEILIGTIMQLIPGFAVGFSINDMVTGNIISGMMRFLQSLLTAVMIALGYAAALLLLGGLI